MTQRSIYQNLDPTLNGYHPDWYDKNAKLISRKPGCSVISYQCNGTGILYDYSIFPGIDLIFMDFNCSDIFDEPNEMRNVLEIRHYQEGRVEFEFEGDKVFHLQQDEFCVNGMLNMPARYSFPFDYCSGLSLVLDKNSMTEVTRSQLALFQIDISVLEEDLDTAHQWYICKTPPSMCHVFEELYAAKEHETSQYFRIKVLELLYHATKLRKEDRVAATYYAREHIEIVKRVRKATAFSDPENEYLIQKAFEKLIQNKTVIMIAHRLSTIRNADQILVMEHGQLIEQGTHDTLMERQGKYTQMWNSYMESISWKIRAGKGGAIE